MPELKLPENEPIFPYAPGDAAREELKRALSGFTGKTMEIPCVIDGKPVRTGKTRKVVMPHAHGEALAEFHLAGADELRSAAEAALRAKRSWESRSAQERASVFLKAADLISGPYRARLNAATMLGQSKNAYQAEIDSACELIDFLRFNAFYCQEIAKRQPLSVEGVRNKMEYRALEGFVLAITPFNFTAIGGNLPSCPALLGNTVVWKPSDTQVFSAWHTFKIFEEAGLPPGVINFVPADGPLTGETLVRHRDLAGVHFTGSTGTFRSIFKTVGENIANYRSYPRLVGETGGKDFVFAHPSADADALCIALVRGAFEYQGQKCSAASRAYVPRSIWEKMSTRLGDEIRSIKMGDVRDFSNFMNAVIDERSFRKISGYLDWAKSSNQVDVFAGGKANGEKGYFVEPTVLVASDPKARTMVEEIFGPVLTVYVYEDSKWKETAELCDQTSPYALTGAVFAQDPEALDSLSIAFRHSAGNFYVNDKPTGAVVAQQPFGGARASGTNDKAGSELNLLRWLSPRTVKENLAPPRDSYAYPFMRAP